MEKRHRGQVYLGLIVLSLFWIQVVAWTSEKAIRSDAATGGQTKEKTNTESKKKALDGIWTGTYLNNGKANEVSVDLVQNGAVVTGTIALADSKLNIEKGSYDAKTKKLTFEIEANEGQRYQVMGTVTGDSLEGQWKGAVNEGTFKLSRK